MWAEGASDSALGFRATLEECYPTTRTQCCWVHMTATVLNAVPKTVQPQAKQAQHEIWKAATSEDAGAALHDFIATYETKYPNATMDLVKGCDSQPTFYDFPATKRQQLRATNPTEPAFVTIRLRTIRAKRRAARYAVALDVHSRRVSREQLAEFMWLRLSAQGYRRHEIRQQRRRQSIEPDRRLISIHAPDPTTVSETAHKLISSDRYLGIAIQLRAVNFLCLP